MEDLDSGYNSINNYAVFTFQNANNNDFRINALNTNQFGDMELEKQFLNARAQGYNYQPPGQNVINRSMSMPMSGSTPHTVINSPRILSRSPPEEKLDK